MDHDFETEAPTMPEAQIPRTEADDQCAAWMALARKRNTERQTNNQTER